MSYQETKNTKNPPKKDELSALRVLRLCVQEAQMLITRKRYCLRIINLSIQAFIALALSALFTLTVVAQTNARPNVVVILVDDMGWSDIGCYGGEIPTPNLDALAAKGVRFTQFYNTPRCSPTRASLLTGLYPHQAGMGHLDNVVREGSLGTTGKLNEHCVTMAEVLRESGYFTAMAGKWHLGQHNGTPPWQRGFERVLNLRVGGIFFANQNFQGGGDELTRRGQEPLYLDGQPVAHDSAVLGQNWYTTFLWADFGLKFVDEAQKANKPFFLYLPHNAPHFPLMAPQELIAKHRGKYRAGWDRLRAERYRRQIKMGLIDARWPLSPRAAESPAWDSLSDEERERFDHLMSVYAAMIEAIDTSVGTLVKGLQARGALDNTLILFLSDNGGNAESGPAGRFNGDPPGGPNSNLYLGMNWAALNNTPFRRFKHFTHEGGISTPLIAHWPQGIPRARHNQLELQPGHLVDLMATVVDVTGAKYPRQFKGKTIQPMEGVSLRPAFAGRPLKRPQPICWEHEGNRAIRAGKWKLVSTYLEAWELYDINADRVEGNDLAAKHPDIVKKLAGAWEAWAKRANVDQWTGPRRTNWGEEIRPANK
jgi:arylsulfatase A-like enzyme